MSLGEHLIELRKRLFWAGVAIVGGAIGGWFLAEFVWDMLREPVTLIAEARGADAEQVATINYTSITGAFEVRFQIALVLGIVVSSPVWLYQIFAFLVPALNRREKRYTFGFFFSAVPLFLAGCFGGWVIVPHIVTFMAQFVPPQDTTFFEAKYYLDFVLKLVLATGIAFVLPVFLVLLNFLGVVSGKAILKGWRWAILGITIFTAAATPAADVISMLLLALPIIALYFAAVGVAFWHDRVAARRLEASLADGLPAGG